MPTPTFLIKIVIVDAPVYTAEDDQRFDRLMQPYRISRRYDSHVEPVLAPFTVNTASLSTEDYKFLLFYCLTHDMHDYLFFQQDKKFVTEIYVKIKDALSAKENYLCAKLFLLRWGATEENFALFNLTADEKQNLLSTIQRELNSYMLPIEFDSIEEAIRDLDLEQMRDLAYHCFGGKKSISFANVHRVLYSLLYVEHAPLELIKRFFLRVYAVHCQELLQSGFYKPDYFSLHMHYPHWVSAQKGLVNSMSDMVPISHGGGLRHIQQFLQGMVPGYMLESGKGKGLQVTPFRLSEAERVNGEYAYSKAMGYFDRPARLTAQIPAQYLESPCNMCVQYEAGLSYRFVNQLQSISVEPLPHYSHSKLLIDDFILVAVAAGDKQLYTELNDLLGLKNTKDLQQVVFLVRPVAGEESKQCVIGMRLGFNRQFVTNFYASIYGFFKSLMQDETITQYLLKEKCDTKSTANVDACINLFFANTDFNYIDFYQALQKKLLQLPEYHYAQACPISVEHYAIPRETLKESIEELRSEDNFQTALQLLKRNNPAVARVHVAPLLSISAKHREYTTTEVSLAFTTAEAAQAFMQKHKWQCAENNIQIKDNIYVVMQTQGYVGDLLNQIKEPVSQPWASYFWAGTANAKTAADHILDNFRRYLGL